MRGWIAASLIDVLATGGAAGAQTPADAPGASTPVEGVTVVGRRADAAVINGKLAPTTEDPKSATCEFLVATDSLLRAQLGVAQNGGDPFFMLEMPGVSQGTYEKASPNALLGPRILQPTRYPRNVDRVAPPTSAPGSALPQIAQQFRGISTRSVDPNDGSLGKERRLYGRDAPVDPSMGPQFAIADAILACRGFTGSGAAAEVAFRDKLMPTALALFKDGRYAESLDYYQRAFKKLSYPNGADEAALMVGKLYLGAPGVERDVGKALMWLERVAGANFSPITHMPQFDPLEPERNTAMGEAAMILGALYQAGAPGVAKDPQKARKWFDRARYVGHVRACLVLGDIYYFGKDTPRDLARAFKYYKEGATFGDAPAQQALAEMYETGEAPGGRDTKLALAWHSQAARIGHAPSLVAVAMAFETGEGVTADPARALGLYKLAAMAGNAPARNVLGTYFYEGRGIEKDAAMARRWFEQAALDGDPDGMFNLGAMMMKGEGGEADRTRAWVWLKLAQKGENPNAAAAVGVLEARMTAEEKEAAQRLLSPTNG